ncbi:thiol peroxidase [uncultured Clostridium sp.]|jgi:thiol peroxidase|uniref:thiol peroxidase n=1 Tax=uncultured Clostridium sp. TaxID=59620 RepID=UPI00260909FD|nr:thiol peroxidase [uncultured Clostridium sp.]
MRKVILGGNPMSLFGNEIKVGEKFPNFVASNKNLADYDFAKTEGVRIILAVPSVDTPVCDMELKRVAKEVSDLDGIKLIAISKDLPFAQARWCIDTENDDLETVSDYKHGEFGKVTGTLINEVGLLARTSFVVDSQNMVVFAEYLEEVSSEPSYDKLLDAAKAAK